MQLAEGRREIRRRARRYPKKLDDVIIPRWAEDVARDIVTAVVAHF